MGLVAAITGAVGGVMGAGGSLLGGLGASESAKAQARIARQNAIIANNNANTALQQGLVKSQQDYQEGAQRMGMQRAQMAANGIDISSGSALDIQNATAQNTGQNVAADQWDANARAIDFRNQSTNYAAQAQSLKQQARGDIWNSALQAGGSLLGTASQFASKWDDLKFGGNNYKSGRPFGKFSGGNPFSGSGRSPW